MSEKIFTKLSEVMQEIDRHDLNQFKSLSADSEEVRLAIEYLHLFSKNSMAEYLEKMAEGSQIRLGPVKGFAAAACVKNGQDYIVISDQYDAYNARNERVVDLVHEIQFTSPYNLPHKEDEEIESNVFQWLKKREDAIKKAFSKSSV